MNNHRSSIRFIARPFCFALCIGTGVFLTYAQAQPNNNGEALFEHCITCHSVTADNEGKSGPPLFQIVGRKAGMISGYRYSPVIRNSNLIWSAENLNHYLEDPQNMLPGNRMPYSGLSEESERAELIGYLSTLK